MQALLDAIASANFPTDAQRLFHGRGGLYPGCEAWTLDAFPPVWLVTKFGEASPEEVATLTTALQARQAQIAPPEKPLNAVLQTRVAGRSETTVLAGAVPERHVVTEDGARYLVNLTRGKNHGLFLDMTEGRRWVQAHATGAKVLNLFAYTCSFSVAALRGGAKAVVNIDMAHPALATGQHNHQLNGITSGAQFLGHDLFSSWGKVTRLGPYDLVIADPPSHQKGSFVAAKDWPRLLRRLPDLLKPGGHALLCLNAPEIPEQFLHDHLAAQAPELVIEQRLPNPSAFADVSADRALKVLVARLPSLGEINHSP
ncbi:MAG: class I SAM-dependent methyltransferase [Hydrogenophaga sp.]|uniref:class I SAM-dependent methyltransferase n=1 Tax=Hydrogenophaga sp. TaxID=1904254 RepID=UPI0027240F38|nr:class I SAM-dependent methyltransferase [Hydrogenophaga sp.]MDO9481708.1 class I SAM-dependent methyltransferase [Hydrogenophaga sp.]MDP1896135.1 class I SAM-dependent methyltransferase [Hydrogenophaga sp.]MDP2219441.1 class I SAM-dependent methyltransferase [Hydrogenophaga sp.]MDP3346812.1 class I SAM-dependent methyltransferase [Hydrogenophaga sp.]MDP3372676.1 class I SAM-dependent methyltransferase [Hydrogenophaga sp.]